ncbi:MAG: recombination mediator RecR [Tissierellia bacterium]|nr:recombination mediator RecR [Tissierellia bacterium]
MGNHPYPKSMERLIHHLSKLPTIGRKSAQRLAYRLLEMDDSFVEELASSIVEVKEKIHPCDNCGNLTDEKICSICQDPQRDPSIITVVEDSQAVISIEKTKSYHGEYHVLGGLLSPRDNISFEDLNIDSLLRRKEDPELKEVILALSPTTDGDMTANFIAELLKDRDITVSRIAKGIPIGANLDSFDETSLYMAIQERRKI